MKRLFPIMLFSLGSCVGTEIGNPPTAQVGVDFISVETVPRAALVLDNGVDLTVAQVSIGGLSFTTCEDEEGSDFVSEPFKGELIQSGPELSIAVPLGEYCQVDIRPRIGTDTVPPNSPELVGLSIFASGTFEGEPIEIRYEGEPQISFSGEFEIESRTSTLFITVELNAWFANLDLSAADRTDGAIVLSSTQNADLLDTFGTNFENSISVAGDDDDDGELDEDELDD